MDDRKAFEAMIYLLRTGSQWNALPRELGASSTVHDRFQEWERAGFFLHLWQAGLTQYDEIKGIAWEWQSMDGVMTKAPLGKDATGPNPTDRGKQGVKRSLLTDADGIPLALVVDGANRHDIRLFIPTLDGIVIARPEPSEASPQNLCLDAAYDADWVRTEIPTREYQPHIRKRGEEKAEKALIPGAKARRWVVERTHSWLNRSRRILIRWEKKVENYLAFLFLACAQLLFGKVFRLAEVSG
jgi:putative transposase